MAKTRVPKETANTMLERDLERDVDTGAERSAEITTNATPGTLTTITLPDAAKGFRLYPRGAHVRFAVYPADVARTLAAVAASSATTFAAASFAIGGIAKQDTFETRLLPPFDGQNSRILTLRSITASVVVDVEVF